MPAAGSISALDRHRNIAELEHREFDLVLIGGGITGAGIACEAVLHGLSVALLEAQDYAAGTSSRSSKLIHGALRTRGERSSSSASARWRAGGGRDARAAGCGPVLFGGIDVSDLAGPLRAELGTVIDPDDLPNSGVLLP